MNAHALSILVVEDNPADIFLIREHLKSSDLSIEAIREAPTLTAARQILAQKKIDVILLDLSLPDSNGFDTITLIQDIVQYCPAIVLSGMNDSDVALDSVKQGAQDYLVKGDFDEKLLAKSIRYAIERKRHIDQILYSEERYKLLFERNPVPMLAFSIDTWQIIMINQAAIRHYGYTKEEFLGLTIDDIQVTDEGPSLTLEMNAMRNTDDIRTFRKKSHKCKDGSIIEVELVSHSIVIDGISATLMVVYDVTAQKKVERHLRLLESVITNATDSVVITEARPFHEPGPRIIYVNEAFSKMTGYSSTEAIGKSPRFLQGPKTDRVVLKKLQEAMHQWQGVEVELINYRKNGEEFWVNFSIIPIANENGSYTHWISIQRDTTVRREQEAHIRATLEKKVEERTRELNEALLKQKELVEMKGRFISTASHEFKTPLATINFAAGFIKKYKHKLLPEEIDSKLQNIENQVQHMTFLLNDVLTIGKSEAGKIETFNEEIDVVAFFKKIIEEIEYGTHYTHKIEFNYNLSKKTICADSKLLRNIFINLITNAIKFSPGKDSIVVSLSEIDPWLLVKIKDNGIGIAPEELAGIFEPFQRGKNVTAIPGTGLGLSIVKRAIETLRGSIQVSSSPGNGSTFLVKLPL